MNVMFLLHLPPPVHGSSVVGGQIYGSSIIRRKFETSWINLLASDEVSGTGKVTVKKFLGAIDCFFLLLRNTLFKRPKLCYFALTASGTAFLRDSILVAVLKLFSIPIVLHLHNKGYSGSVGWIRRRLYRFVFNNAKVILLSERLFQDVSRYVKKEDVYICPNGMKDSGFGIRIVKDATSKPNLLFLSNLIESKGVFVLLEACEILVQRGFSFHCNIVGGEGDISVEEVGKIIKAKGLENNIRYLGKKYGEEKAQIYAESDIFVFPTFYPMECFPLVLIEAIASGLPCISTDEGGIQDLVINGLTGLIVEKRNPHDLADKLEQLISNPELRRTMGEAGRKHYDENFTLEKFENRMLQILQTCVRAHQSNENLLV